MIPVLSQDHSKWLKLSRIQPLGFWSWIADTAAGVWAWLARTLDWALLYILVGASIVLPLYLLRQFLRRRRS